MLGKVNDYLDFVHSGQIYEHLNKDDFVFNAGKVNAPMYRIWESCVGLFMQDVGEEYVYLDYDMLPENIDIDKLTEKAFENLSRDIDYRMEENKEKGIFGLLAGGDFEAESLCFGGIM